MSNKKAISEIDKFKQYPLEEALELVKKTSKTKFNSSVEVHFRLGIDNKKSEQQLRGAVSLPHGTGKVIRVVAFVTEDKIDAVKNAGADFAGSEEIIAEIKRTEKTDFDVSIAEPIMMPKLAQIAKILGTRGLMPSPKNETITVDPVKAVQELKKGKVSFKNDTTGNLHVVIGKVSFETNKLIENYRVLLDTVVKSKPQTIKGLFIKNITVCSSMGSGVKVQI
ncbi:50S ribosomal protein L1 [Patescibacteria group bacterium]|nr:50S ribosomal protein L1 [Patescibacteria group bacterium]